MKHAKITVADGAAGDVIVAVKANARVAIYGVVITTSAPQSPRLENTADGTEITTFRITALGAGIFIMPLGPALWQSKVGSGVQVDTATVDAAAVGITEIDIWFDYIDEDIDLDAGIGN